MRKTQGKASGKSLQLHLSAWEKQCAVALEDMQVSQRDFSFCGEKQFILLTGACWVCLTHSVEGDTKVTLKKCVPFLQTITPNVWDGSDL